MSERDLSLNLGMLCCCCNFNSYQLPEIEGITEQERHEIEELCKICIDSSKRSAVNS